MIRFRALNKLNASSIIGNLKIGITSKEHDDAYTTEGWLIGMGNTIAAWKLGAEGSEPEKLNIAVETLDEGTRQLPGGGYTTFRTFDRFRVLRLHEHFERLEETARLADQPVSIKVPCIRHSLRMALESFPAAESRVRLTLDLEDSPGTLYALAEILHVPNAEEYLHGVKAVTRTLHRSNPKAKLTNFIATAAEVRKTLPQGINEAIMIGENGHALEGLSSNFFGVRGGVVWTAEEGVLSGITRSLVLEEIGAQGIPLRLEGVPVEEIAALDEAFVTSASRAVLPVTMIDDRPVGNGKPGPVTRRLMEGYKARIEAALEEIN